MIITIEGKQYTLNIEKAQQSGCLIPVYEPKAGDVFKSRDGEKVILMELYDNKFMFSGNRNKAFKCYSNEPQTSESVKKYLKDSNWIYLGNISASIEQLLIT